jgi:hypothetical protein
MKRILPLAVFLTRDLFRSLASILPVASALAFGLIAFEYGMDQSQFITVAGVGTSALCLMTTLLLASRANRASSYLLLARLHRRAEFQVALILSGLGITAALAILITAGNLLAGRLSLDLPSALWVIPTWLALWLLSGALALPLSALCGRGGSHLAGYVLLAALLVANDQKEVLAAHGWDWMAKAVSLVVWPLATLLSQASADVHGQSYLLAEALTLAYASLLFGLATTSFEGKDLLWSE